MSQLHRLIAGVRRRWFAAVALRTIGIAALAAALPVMATVVVDLLLAPQDTPLILLGVCAVVLAVAAAANVAWRI